MIEMVEQNGRITECDNFNIGICKSCKHDPRCGYKPINPKKVTLIALFSTFTLVGGAVFTLTNLESITTFITKIFR